MEKFKSVVLVTGAGSGIGQATAIEFASKGFIVVGCDMSAEGLERTRGLVDTAQFHPQVVDVRIESQIQAAFEYVKSLGLPLHAVAACAGVARTSEIHTMDEREWNFTMGVNVTGVWLTAKYALPIFLEQHHGAFVAVGSDASVRGATGYSTYCASKHAVLGLIRCMALDYGDKGVRSNIVCPGFVQTPMMDGLFAASENPEAEMQAYAREIPIGRFALPSEVAKVISHLASDEASYTNGAIYNIDGGVTAGHFG